MPLIGMSRAQILLRLLPLVSMCSCTLVWKASDEDAGRRPIVDAGTPDAMRWADATPGCTAWILQSVPIHSIESMETMPIHPERSARFMVEMGLCPGDEVGEWGFEPTLENEYMYLTMTRWQKEGTWCDAAQIVQRPITITFPYAGTWILKSGALQEVVEVVETPGGTCGSSSDGCVRDCDCPYREVCLSADGLGGPFSKCGRPCEFDRECGGGARCLSTDDGLQHVCVDGVDECELPDLPCPDGFDCVEGSCEPTFVLNQFSRRDCSSDDDCDGPLRCVVPSGWCQLPNVCATGGDGGPPDCGPARGRCEIFCPTSSDGWCQGPHTCGRASIEGDNGVCEWVGE